MEYTDAIIYEVPEVAKFKFARISGTNYVTIGKSIQYLPFDILNHKTYYIEPTTKYESIATDFEILACVKPPVCPSSPCGTFINYDTVNGIYDPEYCGFKAGFYADGTDVYVGSVNNAVCFNESLVPTRLSTNYPAGGYTPSCGVETFETETVKYLLNHSNLQWIKVNYQNMTSTNAITLESPGVGTYKIARINAVTSSGFKYVTIGKSLQTFAKDLQNHDTYW